MLMVTFLMKRKKQKLIWKYRLRLTRFPGRLASLRGKLFSFKKSPCLYRDILYVVGDNGRDSVIYAVDIQAREIVNAYCLKDYIIVDTPIIALNHLIVSSTSYRRGGRVYAFPLYSRKFSSWNPKWYVTTQGQLEVAPVLVNDQGKKVLVGDAKGNLYLLDPLGKSSAKIISRGRRNRLINTPMGVYKNRVYLKMGSYFCALYRYRRRSWKIKKLYYLSDRIIGKPIFHNNRTFFLTKNKLYVYPIKGSLSQGKWESVRGSTKVRCLSFKDVIFQAQPILNFQKKYHIRS